MKTIEVAAGLVFHGGRLLIAQRPAGGHLPGVWEFPGGKREPDESFEDCLRRELKEELGIEVSVGEIFESITHAYLEQTVHVRFFRCEWLKHEPRALGCPAFRWVTAQDLRHLEFPAADARLLEELQGNDALWR